MRMDMSDEKKPLRKKLLPEGWRLFSIINAEMKTSKAGNEMVVFTIQDAETKYEEDIYAITEPKKRWFLKSILDAIGHKAAEDGVYDFKLDDFINKEFQGLIEHEPNSWIDREGNKQEGLQHRIVDVKAGEGIADWS